MSIKLKIKLKIFTVHYSYDKYLVYRPKMFFGNSPFRGISPYGAIRRIFKMTFYRLF